MAARFVAVQAMIEQFWAKPVTWMTDTWRAGMRKTCA
jgi:hypothetical protein